MCMIKLLIIWIKCVTNYKEKTGERERQRTKLLVQLQELPRTYHKEHKYEEDKDKDAITQASQPKVLGITFPCILIC